MKKAGRRVVSVSILVLGLWSITGFPATAEEKEVEVLLISDDFEIGKTGEVPEGWNPVAEAIGVKDSYAAHSGMQALRIETHKDWGAMIRTSHPKAESGKVYRVSVWVSTHDLAYLSVMGMPGEVGEIKGYAEKGWGWQNLSVDYKVPDGVKNLYIGLYVVNKNYDEKTGGSLSDNWWDDFKLVNIVNPSEQASEQVSSLEWGNAKRVIVSNPSIVDITTAVSVEVDGKTGERYAVTDTNGYPVTYQADDLNGDGTIDEVSFFATVSGESESKFLLFSGKGESPGFFPAFKIREERMGSWQPFRFSPTTSPGPSFDSSFISDYNRRTAKKLIDVLNDERPMTVLEGDSFHLIIGNESGMVEGMYPTALRGFTGSYFREYIPEWQPKGTLSLVANGTIRAVFDWKGQKSSRRIIVYGNGEIQTKWLGIPEELHLISSAHPYTFLATGPNDIIRFSQILEKSRSLPVDSQRHCLFGFEDQSLECRHEGLRLMSEELWLDPGEMMFELAIQQQKEHKTAERDMREYVFPIMKRLCRTYLGGGVRIVRLKADANNVKISYRVGKRGKQVLESFQEKPLKVSSGGYETDFNVKRIIAEPKPLFEIKMPDTALTVTRIYPNHFNGWKLRPLMLAKHNPLPAFYPIILFNKGTEMENVKLSLEAGPWILEAQILSQSYILRGTTDYRKEEPVGPDGNFPILTVPPGGEISALLRIRAKEETIGKYPLKLKWKTGKEQGEFKLTLTVKPDVIFHSMHIGWKFSRENYDMLKYFTNVLPGNGMYYARIHGGLTPEREEHIRMGYKDAQRKGFYIQELMHIREYVQEHFTRKDWEDNQKDELFKLEPEEFAKRLREIYRQSSYLEPYRWHLYVADEIWETLGADHTWSVEGFAKLTEEIVEMTETPAFNSFMVPGVDDGYHVKIPNDIPFTFFYCGYDEGVKKYANKIRDERLAQFKEWCSDPSLLKRAGVSVTNPLFAFWISARLHQDDYRSVRRHLWWLRHNGFDCFSVWALGSWNLVYGNIGDWASMGTGENGFILTDRAMAIMDSREDMSLISLVRLLKKDADKAIQEKVSVLESQAYQLSQENEFDRAVHCYVEAVKLMRSDLAYLTPPDYYHSVKTASLTDLTEEDKAGLEEAEKLPSVVLTKISGKNRPSPVLDGKLDNSYVEEGALAGNFYLLDGSAHAKEQTQVYLARDTENLYILFRCQETNMNEVRGVLTQHDTGVYTEDSIEIFIQPESGQDLYFQLAASISGTKYDRKVQNGIHDIGWNPKWETSTVRDSQSWSIELRIPFSSIIGKEPNPGEVWRMNFCRNDIPHGEISSWSAVFGGFHRPERFGKVQFIE